jgi:preprotein translocase YajC subunit
VPISAGENPRIGSKDSCVLKDLPLIIIVVLFVGLMMFNRRAKARSAAAEQSRKQKMQPGTEVMTTSGLYATVVSVDAEEATAILSVAPAVEVKWSLAALRDVTELPRQYRKAIDTDPADGSEQGVRLDKPLIERDEPDAK